MPLINPGNDPTWAEIQAGIEANKVEREAIEASISASEAAIAGANQNIRQQKGEMRRVDNNLRRWLEAIEAKAGED